MGYWFFEVAKGFLRENPRREGVGEELLAWIVLAVCCPPSGRQKKESRGEVERTWLRGFDASTRRGNFDLRAGGAGSRYDALPSCSQWL